MQRDLETATLAQDSERRLRIQKRRERINVAKEAASKDLPRGVHFKHGAYYLVFQNKWHRLGTSIDMQAIDRIRGRSGVVDALRSFLNRKFQAIKSGAKQRKLAFEISQADLILLGDQQAWRCAISNLPFTLEKVEGIRVMPYSPSVDRIDNGKGYVAGNVRLVCAALNIARSNLPDSVFLHITVHAGLELSKKASQPENLRRL